MYLEETFILDETNSGQNGYKIVYTSWGDEQATLTMSKKFTGFTLHDSQKNIWKINIGENTYSRTAYFNDVLGIRARTVGYLKNVEYVYKSHFLCDNKELLNLAYPNEVELVHHMTWYNVVYQAKSFTKVNGRIRIDMHDAFYTDANRIDYYDRDRSTLRQTPSYLENAYEFLDESGEWYLNKHEGYLYYIPRQGESMTDMELKLPIGEEMIKVAGSNLANPVCHIAFDNLKIEGTTWLNVERMGAAEFIQNNKLSNTNTRLNPEGFIDRTSVYFYACRYIDITNCDFRHLGSAGAAVLFYEGAKHVNVIGNEFYELGGAGLEFDYPRNSTPYNRSDSSLCEYINVENNYFHDISLDFNGGSAISLGHPRHVRVRYNEISNTFYSGIHIGWGWAQLEETGTPMYDVEISYNYIHDIMVDRVNDGAHIYTLGPSSYECDMTADAPNNGANKNRIVNNYLVNGWSCSAVYPDNGSTSWYVANNVCDTGFVDEMEYNFEGQTPIDEYYWMHMHIDTIKWITTENNYSQLDYAYVADQMNQQESSVEPTQLIKDGEFPAEAKAIISGAGIKSEHRDKFNLSGPKVLVAGDRMVSLPLGTPIDSKLMILGDNNTKYNISDYKIEWWIDDNAAVTIDKNGMLTAHKKGTFEAEAFVFVGGLWQSKHFMLVCGEDVEMITANKLSSLSDYAMGFENGSSLAVYMPWPSGWTSATENGISKDGNSMQLVTDPLGVENKVLKVDLATTTNDYAVTLRTITGSGSGSRLAEGTIPASGKVVCTFRYRFEQEMNSSNGEYNGKTYYPEFSINMGSGRFATSAERFGNMDGEWYMAKLVYKNDSNEAIKISEASLRIGGTNSDGNGKYRQWVAQGHTGYNASTGTYDLGERTIYFDDFRFAIFSEQSSLDGYEMNFENGSSLAMYTGRYYYNLSETEQTSGSGETVTKAQLVADPTNGTNTVAKIKMSSTSYGSVGALRFSNSTEADANVPTAGTKIPDGSRIVYTFRYYLPQTVKDKNVFGDTEYSPGFCVYNSTESGNIKFATSAAHLETEANKWHTAVLSYTNDTGVSEVVDYAMLRFEGDNATGTSKYTQWTAEDHNGFDPVSNTYDLGERTIYFDDFKVYVEKAPEKDRISTLNNYKMSFEYGASVAIYTDKYVNAGQVARTNNSETIQIKKDPENDNNTVLKVTLSSDANGSKSTLRFSKTRTLNADAVQVSGIIPAGCSIKYTFRYFFPQEMKNENIYGGIVRKPAFCIVNSIGGVVKYAVSSESFPTESNKWHTAELVYSNTTSNAQTIDYASLRYEGDNLNGDSNYTNWTVADYIGYNSTTGRFNLGEREIYFDDFRTVIEEIPVDEKVQSLADYSMNFESGSSVAIYADRWVNAQSVASTNNDETVQLIADPENSDNTVLSVTLASNFNGGNTSLRLSRSSSSSGAAYPAVGILPAGKRLVYTFDYYLPDEVENKCTHNGKDYIPAFHIVNPIEGGEVKIGTSLTAFETETGKWHKAILTYVNNTTTSQSISYANLRLSGDNLDGMDKYKNWILKGHTGYDDGSNTGDYGVRMIYFDNFKVYIDDAPAPDRVNSITDYKMGFEYGSSLAVYTNQWTVATAAPIAISNGKSVMQIVKDPENEMNNVLKSKLGADVGGGYLIRNIMGNGNGAGYLAGLIPAGAKVTYSFRYYFDQEMESSYTYNGVTYIPQFCMAQRVEGKGTVFAVSEEPFGTENKKWHTATITYTNTSGVAQSIAEVNLRFEGENSRGEAKYMQWIAKGHKGYNPDVEKYDLGERVIYLDDFTVKVENNPISTIKETKIERINSGIKVSAYEAINGAVLIFVKYDINGKMVAANCSTIVSIGEQNAKPYAIPSGYEHATAMLWKNMTTCVPLAKSINY